jgi:NADPH-dependent 2,4-dienoyl-CoA reductase/sulfur reductase-like enzyme
MIPSWRETITRRFATHGLSVILALAAGADDRIREADVCVYGGTASGVMAPLAAEREGARVIVIEPSRWLGGMTGGGINGLDWGKAASVGGSAYRMLKGNPILNPVPQLYSTGD